MKKSILLLFCCSTLMIQSQSVVSQPTYSRPDQSATNEFAVPLPPLLTTKSSNLEVCEGNSTTLTAMSDYPIEWYANYPFEGEPVGRGNVFVTPSLNQGYYIYHAVANNKGIKSSGSEMEVVMVYPLPLINIIESSKSICTGETATVTVFGTRYYFWNTGETTNEITIQPQQTTNYLVTGMNTAGCKQTKTYTQIVENCKSNINSSTIEISLGEIVQVSNTLNSTFPNPNNGEFNVRLNSFTESTRIELYNSFGELVLKIPVIEEQTRINLNYASAGIYTLHILEQNQLFKKERVLIEK